MAFRFRKSIRLGKFARINISKTGIGASAGMPGARVGVSRRGAYKSVGIPGTGVSDFSYIKGTRTKSSTKRGGCLGCAAPVALLLVAVVVTVVVSIK